MLTAVPELGHYEISVGALGPAHTGRTIAVRAGASVVVGPLVSVTESALHGGGRVVVRVATGDGVGDIVLGLHPAHPVTIVPTDRSTAITVAPRKKSPPKPLVSNPNSRAVVADAARDPRAMYLLPGRYRNRRKCHCGCGGKQSHRGTAGGVTMVAGCEWAVRYWVTHAELPIRRNDQTT